MLGQHKDSLSFQFEVNVVHVCSMQALPCEEWFYARSGCKCSYYMQACGYHLHNFETN